MTTNSVTRRTFLAGLGGLTAATALAGRGGEMPAARAEHDGGVVLGKLGVIAYLDSLPGAQTAPFARKVEQLGYSVLWFPETFGRDSFAIASHLLTSTKKLVLASGIANVWKREPVTMIGAARTLSELFNDRFILGLGVSSGPFMASRGLKYDKPVSYMKEYLAHMKAADHMAPRPLHDPPIVLAALLPKMLRLAAAETQGVITAFLPPSSVAKVRTVLGPEKWLCAQQALMLEPDAKKARQAARAFLQSYLRSPNYQKSWKRVGFTDADLADGGSDGLVDALVAWGNEATLRERIAAHYKAGATHVCISPLSSKGGLQPDLRALTALAPR